MKILLVEPYTRTSGHFAWFALRTAEGLARRGHDVTLVTYGGIALTLPADSPDFVILDAAEPRNRSSRAVDKSAARPFCAPVSFLGWRRMEFRALAFVACRLRHQDFDVVHFLDAEAVTLELILNIIATKSERRINVLTVHSLTEISTAPEGLMRSGYRWLYRLALRKLVARDLSGVVVLSEAVRADMVNLLRIGASSVSRIRVVPLGMDESHATPDRHAARLRLKLPQTEPIFLLLGHLRKDKRVDLAIEAFSGLPCGYMVIAGEVFDLDSSLVGQWIGNYLCREKIRSELHYLSELRIGDYLAAADVVLLPYSASFKGQSGILTQACSYGRSVIVSETGGLGEIVSREGMGLVVAPDDAAALREGMLRFLALTAEERLQMEIRSRAAAERFSWNSVCRIMEKYYMDLSAVR